MIVEPGSYATPSRPPPPAETTAPRKSKRTRKKPARYIGGSSGLEFTEAEGVTLEQFDQAYLEHVELYTNLVAPNEPANYQEAISCPDTDRWRSAMTEELKSLETNGTWEIVPRPENRAIISSKWVYKLKLNGAGEVVRYKARLVARGFTQVFGMDYNETYAPVTRLETIRLLMALAVEKDWEIRQIDVKTAYLNGELDEEIYMEPPPGYDVPEGHVLRLLKALYGLKQAGRQWYKKLKDTMKKFGLKQVMNDPHTFVFSKVIGGIKKYLIIPIYVDDLIPVGDKLLTDDFEAWIPKYFDVTIIGDASLFLGIRVTRDKTADPPFLVLDQLRFVDTILERFNIPEREYFETPFLSKDLVTNPAPVSEASREIVRSYQSKIGSLMYLMLGTRPDIAFIVGKLSRFSSNPSADHMNAVARLFRYISYSRDQCIKYTKQNGGKAIDPTGFTDADHATDKENRKSISGYVFFLGDGAISWYSKQQSTIAQSTAEAEAMALNQGAKQAFWFHEFYSQIGLPLSSPILLHCDSTAAIAIAKGEQIHSAVKHIAVKELLVRDYLDKGLITIEYIESRDNTADIFTKALPKETFDRHVDNLGLDFASDYLPPADIATGNSSLSFYQDAETE